MIAFVLLCALSDPGLPIATVAQGVMSSIDEPLQAVARTQAEWERLWKRHGSAQPAPAVDFGKTMVVGVFLGSRPTAGYRVEIARIDVEGSAVVVRYAENEAAGRPDGGAGADGALPPGLVRQAGRRRQIRAAGAVGRHRPRRAS